MAIDPVSAAVILASMEKSNLPYDEMTLEEIMAMLGEGPIPPEQIGPEQRPSMGEVFNPPIVAPEHLRSFVEGNQEPVIPPQIDPRTADLARRAMAEVPGDIASAVESAVAARPGGPAVPAIIQQLLSGAVDANAQNLMAEAERAQRGGGSPVTQSVMEMMSPERNPFVRTMTPQGAQDVVDRVEGAGRFIADVPGAVAGLLTPTEETQKIGEDIIVEAMQGKYDLLKGMFPKKEKTLEKDVSEVTDEEATDAADKLEDAGVPPEFTGPLREPAPEGEKKSSGISFGAMLAIILGGAALGGVLSTVSSKDRRGRPRVDLAQGILGGALAGARGLGAYGEIQQAKADEAEAEAARLAEIERERNQSALELLTNPKFPVSAEANPELLARAQMAAGVSELNLERPDEGRTSIEDINKHLLAAQKARDQGQYDLSLRLAKVAGQKATAAGLALNYSQMPSIDVWTMLRTTPQFSQDEKRRAFLTILDRGDFQRPQHLGGFEFSKKEVRQEAKNLGIKLDDEMKAAIDLAFEEVPGPIGGQ